MSKAATRKFDQQKFLNKGALEPVDDYAARLRRYLVDAYKHIDELEGRRHEVNVVEFPTKGVEL